MKTRRPLSAHQLDRARDVRALARDRREREDPTALSTRHQLEPELAMSALFAQDWLEPALVTSDLDARHQLAEDPTAELSTRDRLEPELATSELSARDRLDPECSTSEPFQPDTQSKPKLKRKRRVSAGVARAVFLRDGGQCSYVSPEGRRCSARKWLELDHREPWAVGGEATIENLRLCCRAHNQRYARQYFGKSRVEAAVQHCRQRRTVAQRSGEAEQPVLAPDMHRSSSRGVGGHAVHWVVVKK